MPCHGGPSVGDDYSSKLASAEAERDLATRLLCQILGTLETTYTRSVPARDILGLPEVNAWWMDHKRKDIERKNAEKRIYLRSAEAKLDELKGDMRRIANLGGVAGPKLIAKIHKAEQEVEDLKKKLGL
jgi:hypothetical protein